jgi:hypothetical protein
MYVRGYLNLRVQVSSTQQHGAAIALAFSIRSDGMSFDACLQAGRTGRSGVLKMSFQGILAGAVRTIGHQPEASKDAVCCAVAPAGRHTEPFPATGCRPAGANADPDAAAKTRCTDARRPEADDSQAAHEAGFSVS